MVMLQHMLLVVSIAGTVLGTNAFPYGNSQSRVPGPQQPAPYRQALISLRQRKIPQSPIITDLRTHQLQAGSSSSSEEESADKMHQDPWEGWQPRGEGGMADSILKHEDEDIYQQYVIGQVSKLPKEEYERLEGLTSLNEANKPSGKDDNDDDRRRRRPGGRGGPQPGEDGEESSTAESPAPSRESTDSSQSTSPKDQQENITPSPNAEEEKEKVKEMDGDGPTTRPTFFDKVDPRLLDEYGLE